jgi:hypothetical protein
MIVRLVLEGHWLDLKRPLFVSPSPSVVTGRGGRLMSMAVDKGVAVEWR